MKTAALTLLLVSVALSGCDTAPVGEGPADAGKPTASCTLDPSSITQVATVTSVTPTGACGDTALVSVSIEKGNVNGTPIVVTDVKSYDGTSLGVRCVYDVTGTVNEAVDATCSVSVGFTVRVKVE